MLVFDKPNNNSSTHFTRSKATSLFLPLKRRPKLFQKPYIIFKKQSYIINLIFEHGYPFNSHPKSETGINLRINSTVIKNIGINHSTSQDLNPSGIFADTATFSPTNKAGDIHLCRGLCKWEIGWPKTDACIFTKQLMSKIIKGLFQICKRNIFVNIQAFNLVKDTMGTSRDRFITEYPSWQNHPDGRL